MVSFLGRVAGLATGGLNRLLPRREIILHRTLTFMKTRWNPDTRDISVSSFLMRQFAFAHAVSDVASVFTEVESRYCSFQDIVALSAAIGAQFRPLVVEASGSGWAPALREVVGWMASEFRFNPGSRLQDIGLTSAQRISCNL